MAEVYAIVQHTELGWCQIVRTSHDEEVAEMLDQPQTASELYKKWHNPAPGWQLVALTKDLSNDPNWHQARLTVPKLDAVEASDIEWYPSS